jgi:hypothetical protein
MAGDSKNTRSERDPQTLVRDLLRRATSPEVLAGVAGAAAAARFTKHMVEESDETDVDEEPELGETDVVQDAGDDESDAEEEPDDGERQEPSAEEEPDDGERQEPSAEEEPDDGELQEPSAGEEPDDDDEGVPEGAAEPESDDDGEADPSHDEDTEEREETPDSSAAGNGSVGTDDERMKLLDQARRYAEQLTGHPVESFSSLEQDDRGWRIGIEVVELSRVPSTTDVLGSYELVLSDEGEFVDFRRAHRYSRNSTDETSS